MLLYYYLITSYIATTFVWVFQKSKSEDFNRYMHMYMYPSQLYNNKPNMTIFMYLISYIA